MTYSVAVLGTRGIPAKHGGFETFAEELSLDLVRRGVSVSVHCQLEPGEPAFVDEWCGVSRIGTSGLVGGALGTVLFDLRCVFDVIRRKPDVVLTLGYNTAIFNLLLRLAGIPNVINMDGIEWRRSKWGRIARAWFWFNEWAGARLGNLLVADHPEIKSHLARHGVSSKTVVIPYGAHAVAQDDIVAPEGVGVVPGGYFCVIARPEPENSILEIVQAFSRRKRGAKLLVLGAMDYGNSYHVAIRNAASDEVILAGAIYDRAVVGWIRLNCIAYVHGHTVGGTNPSLVEALGAGAPVIAHDNPYNRWVAASSAVYFSSIDQLDDCYGALMEPDVRGRLIQQASSRHSEAFQWSFVLDQYDQVLRNASGRSERFSGS